VPNRFCENDGLEESEGKLSGMGLFAIVQIADDSITTRRECQN